MKPRPPGPPSNQRAREVVAAKRRNIDPEDLAALQEGFRGWHTRGYIPHRDEPGLTQLVTFRLADSMPAKVLREWEALVEANPEQSRHASMDDFLDRGYGSCALRREEIAEIAENAFRHFHGERYELRAWVVMPNHVHVLFKAGAVSMGKTVGSWKHYVSTQANRMLRRDGAFWQADYWDSFIRDGRHEEQARRYVEENPVRARLVKDARAWRWSSARFRTEEGVLEI